MDIEYFAEANVILIHGREPLKIASLRDQISALAADSLARFAVHEIPGFRSVDGCRLFASRAHSDIGTRSTGVSQTFECQLRASTWINIQGLLEPFTESSLGVGAYQHLDSHGNITLIISESRGW